MDPIIQDILVSLVSSLITGAAVWLWQRTRNRRSFALMSRFFGVQPGEKCVVIMSDHHLQTGATSHEDAASVAEAAIITHDLKTELVIATFDTAIEPGSSTEFCIGGPLSNQRTKIHLENYLKGVKFNPFNDKTAPMGIITSVGTFPYEKHVREYAILAKFFSSAKSHPIFLVSGQTSVANRGAMYYLLNHHNELRKKFGSKPFCLVVSVASPKTYGYRNASLEKDISSAAFL